MLNRFGGPTWTPMFVVGLLLPGLLIAQSSSRELKTGSEMFRATCVACHGFDGRGAPDTTRVFKAPATFPDFTDCQATAREPNGHWNSIINDGGPARGFSEIMPSFREALNGDQIEQLIRYIRGFCQEPAWPRGELNLPRALATEKAFPEDETVVDMAIDTDSPHNLTSRVVYERRFGPRNQLDVSIPFRLRQPVGGSWFGGLGDLTLGWKRVLVSSLETGSIFSVAGEAILPTGNESRGLGKGVTVLEGFASYGQILPRNFFLQFQSGLEAPTRTEDAPRAVFWRTVAGRSFSQSGGRGREWSPMVEVLADRDLETGALTNWDAVPQFQVTLSRRQHIRANFGVKIPVNNTAARSPQVMFYLLWDWFDGGLRDGWR